MIQWANRITMSDDVAKAAARGENPDVTFTYIHSSGHETSRTMPLDKAVILAESRRNDGRYKNYEFHIS